MGLTSFEPSNLNEWISPYHLAIKNRYNRQAFNHKIISLAFTDNRKLIHQRSADFAHLFRRYSSYHKMRHLRSAPNCFDLLNLVALPEFRSMTVIKLSGPWPKSHPASFNKLIQTNPKARFVISIAWLINLLFTLVCRLHLFMHLHYLFRFLLLLRSRTMLVVFSRIFPGHPHE
ncbi:MAG: hypothetical protein K0R67_392 [Paenibacillus sp.]|nr:hypothetical protein [Paenibacillus sp.]